MSTWRLGKLLLDKYCLASERVATSMNPMLSPLSRIKTHWMIMAPCTQWKILQLKLLWTAPKPRNLWKFSSAKDSRYTVYLSHVFGVVNIVQEGCVRFKTIQFFPCLLSQYFCPARIQPLHWLQIVVTLLNCPCECLPTIYKAFLLKLNSWMFKKLFSWASSIWMFGHCARIW